MRAMAALENLAPFGSWVGVVAGVVAGVVVGGAQKQEEPRVCGLKGTTVSPARGVAEVLAHGLVLEVELEFSDP